MLYINPILRLNISTNTDGTVDAKTVKLARKRWLAEFELQGTTTIKSGNLVLDKQSVISLFEDLENEQILSYHAELVNFPKLLGFLENQELDFFGQPEDLSNKSTDFQKFIAPFFAYQFNVCFSNAVKKRDLDLIQLLVKDELPVPVEFESDCHQRTYRLLSQKLQELKLLAESCKTINLASKEIALYFNKNTIALLNNLPAYYDGFLVSYAKALNQLALNLYNEHFRYLLAQEILKKGVSLRIDGDTKNQLLDVLGQIEEQTKDHQHSIPGILSRITEDGSNNTKKVLVIIGGIVIGVIFAFLKG